MKNNQAKAYFEIHYQSSISDRNWYRIKRSLRESNLEINQDNLKMIANLKKKADYTKLSLNQLIYCQQQAQTVVNKKVFIKGELVYQELQKISQNQAHRTTILRWFKSVGQKDGKYFDENRNYKVDELVPVFASAFLYVQKKLSNKLPSFNQ